MKKHLVLYINTNSMFKKDGNYFTAEAEKYKKHHEEKGDVVYAFPISGKVSFKSRMLEFIKRISQIVTAEEKIDVIAYFGHGYRTGIQAGFKWKWGAMMLANNIRFSKAEIIILYACSTAKGKDNFAKWLADELNKSLYSPYALFAHSTKGDTSRNPYVVRYDNTSETPVIYRDLVNNWSKWREDLQGSLRFDFPFMSIDNFTG